MIRGRLRAPKTPNPALETQVGLAELRLREVTHHRLRWLDIPNPTEREIEHLRQHYSFHPLNLDDCLSKIQVPKIDEYEDHLFMVLHFPVFNPVARVTAPSEVDFFIGEDFLITLHSANLPPLTAFFQSCQEDAEVRQAFMGRSSGYLLYQVLDRLVDYCFPILNKILANVEAMEDRIFDEQAKESVREISLVRRDIMAYRRIIKPQLAVVASLEEKEFPFLKEDLDVYFSDIADHMSKIWNTLEDYREVVEALKDTNDSLTSFRINEVIRVLTLISTIMLPLSVITGVYGMNIQVLPFAEDRLSFLIITGLMLAVAVAMLAWFRSRRWI